MVRSRSAVQIRAWAPIGSVPKRSNGTGCKPVGLRAFGGSNPSRPTNNDRGRFTYRGFYYLLYMNFRLSTHFKPAGDQPQAIELLTDGLVKNFRYQTLLGVTGSGKTFTIANVIQNAQKPTLVIAHNKTLAAQLCNEFREFFPENSVEYFVSYYDYYQPEAYIPPTDTYIEKESQINDEIDRLRHSATQSLLSRRDVIVVASVSCIYGLGSPENYEKEILYAKKKEPLDRSAFMRKLLTLGFERTAGALERGKFRARGAIIEVVPVKGEAVYRIELNNKIIQSIFEIDPLSQKQKSTREDVLIFPARHFVTLDQEKLRAVKTIREELKERLNYFQKNGLLLEAERLERRTNYDLEMMQEIGYCSGIENYSRHFDGRAPGKPPATLFSYFPKDFLLIIDESHVTIPQLRGMYEGDRSRKNTLIEHGFRLQSARDNRPLTFEEFTARVNQCVFTSATPGEYELHISSQVVEQIIRPTGLADPEVEIRPIVSAHNVKSQVEDVIEEINARTERRERVLVTTLTKKMAEDLTSYLVERGVKTRYLHSDIETLDRIRILIDFRKGVFDCLVGVNLLREGLDLPEVTLVAILDADKEGFLRSETSLIQTIGRAARNVQGKVILYADVITGSIKRAVDETNRRRDKQIAHNKKHGITPRTIKKKIKDITKIWGIKDKNVKEILDLELSAAPRAKIEKIIAEKEREMRESAKVLEFELAAVLRDEVKVLRKSLKLSNKPKNA